MSDDAKCYAATPAATLEQHITDINVPKNEAEWWAYREITRLREENVRLQEALRPFADLFLYPDDLGFEHSEDIRSDPDWDDDANDMQSEETFVLRRDIRCARFAIRKEQKD